MTTTHGKARAQGAGGLEHQGPIDMRSIMPVEIAATRQRAAALLQGVKEGEGQRAAVTAALGALGGAVDALVSLGAESAALPALRMLLQDLEQREARRSAFEPARTLQ